MRVEAIEAAVAPVLASLGLALFDVAVVGSGRATTLRIIVDRPGVVDLETITMATEAISPVLDATALAPGPYTLEVTSPGLERALRKPAHYHGALGKAVSVKARDASGAAERVRGTLTAVDSDGFTVETEGGTRRFEFAAVQQARTIFEWGPAPKPGAPKRNRGVKKEAAR